MAELIWRLRQRAPPRRGRRGDLGWVLVVGGARRARRWLGADGLDPGRRARSCSSLLVVALHQHDRAVGHRRPASRSGSSRRSCGACSALMTGYRGERSALARPVPRHGRAGRRWSCAQYHVPTKIRRVLLLAAAGFAIGLPLGLRRRPAGRGSTRSWPTSTAISAARARLHARALSPRGSTLRRVLLSGCPVIAAYAIAQRCSPLPPWDQEWVDVDRLRQHRQSARDDKVRVFAHPEQPRDAGRAARRCRCSATSPSSHHRLLAIAGAIGARGGAVPDLRALGLGGADRGRGARPRGGLARAQRPGGVRHGGGDRGRRAGAVAGEPDRAATWSNRFETITNLGAGHAPPPSARATFSAAAARGGQRAASATALGSAGEATKLNGKSDAAPPDNGYLALMYQVGPIGFLLVIARARRSCCAPRGTARAPERPGRSCACCCSRCSSTCIVLLADGRRVLRQPRRDPVVHRRPGAGLRVPPRARRAAAPAPADSPRVDSSSRSTTRDQA